jgi:hypothetical protein
MPWFASLENEANQILLKNCTRPATMFSLLGWETAMVMQIILQRGSAGSTTSEAIIAHLKETALNSPRGIIQMDAETQFYIAPVARYELKAGSSIPEIIWTDNVEKEWRAFTAVPTEGAVTGWTNTYLCY